MLNCLLGSWFLPYKMINWSEPCVVSPTAAQSLGWRLGEGKALLSRWKAFFTSAVISRGSRRGSITRPESGCLDCCRAASGLCGFCLSFRHRRPRLALMCGSCKIQGGYQSIFARGSCAVPLSVLRPQGGINTSRENSLVWVWLSEQLGTISFQFVLSGRIIGWVGIANHACSGQSDTC